MDLPHALTEYQDAWEMDTSPLSKLSLAELYQIGGRLEEARLYAEDCLKSGDLFWMLNYGIDPAQYKMEIHEILKNCYKGLENTERFVFHANINEWLNGFVRKIFYGIQAARHGHLYRKYCLLTAGSYGLKNPDMIHPEALTQYYNAFEPYPRRALHYLNQARNFETPLIPESVPFYILEEGRLFNKHSLAAMALEKFDPYWEQDLIAKAYILLAGKGPFTGRAAGELYAINPGALPQNRIPLEVNLKFNGIDGRTQKALEKAIGTAGVKTVSGQKADTAVMRHTLVLYGGEKIVCELYDRNQKIRSESIELPSLSSTHIALFSKTLATAVFSDF